MQKIKTLITVLLFPFFVYSQNSSSCCETEKNLILSAKMEMDDYTYPDSIITYHFMSPLDSSCLKKEIIRYDKSTQTRYIEHWSFDSYIDDWIIHMHSVVKNNNTTTQTSYEWDKTTGSYVPLRKAENTFIFPNLYKTRHFSNVYNYQENKMELLIELRRTERWLNRYNNDSLTVQLKRSSAGKAFQDFEKTVCLYDTFQHRIQESTYQWSDSIWSLKNQIISKYDSTGNCIQRDSYGYLMTGTRYVYTYDSLNNMINYTKMAYKDSQLVNISNSLRQYDEQKRLIQEIEQKWEVDSNRWVNETKTVYELEDNESAQTNSGSSYKTLIYSWSPVLGWQHIYESVMIYNELKMNIEKRSKEWDNSSQTWKAFSKEKYVWDTEKILRLLQIKETRDSEEEDWNVVLKTFYYYDGINVIQDMHEPGIKELFVYPNPVSGILTVTQETPQELYLGLFDMSGKQLLSLVSSQIKIPVDVSELNNGQYILRIRKGNEIVLKKLIKTNQP